MPSVSIFLFKFPQQLSIAKTENLISESSTFILFQHLDQNDQLAPSNERWLDLKPTFFSPLLSCFDICFLFNSFVKACTVPILKLKFRNNTRSLVYFIPLLRGRFRNVKYHKKHNTITTILYFYFYFLDFQLWIFSSIFSARQHMAVSKRQTIYYGCFGFDDKFSASTYCIQ